MPKRARASRRIEQPADPGDVRVVGYGPGDVPVVPDKYAELPVHTEKSGRVDHWNDELMTPEPSSVYVVDKRYLYVTDSAARVTHAEGWLGWLPSDKNEARRNLDAQREAGKPDRERNDDGGHLFGTVFDGPGESINLTAQSRSQNQAVKGSPDNWRRMEESWQALRASGVQVHAAIDVRHQNGTTLRPSSRAVIDRHEGRRSPRRIFRETKPTGRGAE
ncbi:DNA/RNA non-specific endonuclease [Kribbella rubisoli]|uniref:DNA/RNA non-specific endonuclease n=1 Tax=Kribbella rubisoli TaxID=3075929 RepID=A0A4Q7WND4_9ACTN|nr:DNA/RNA non-specific endonuclease [Kribbella rubisoli]RZU11055.1 DNA/RNA non-specific endonuclease [Kribbella rubisoli]